MVRHFMDLAFTNSVRKAQDHYGTRSAYQKMEERMSFRNQLSWQEKTFITARDSFYMASVGENGWPYMQYRGGPGGFLKVLDGNTLAYADFRGNGQYISTGNLKTTGKTVLFLMDYANQQRLKVWAETEVMEAAEHPELATQVIVPDYDAMVERIIVFRVEAFDWNCSQHITPRFTQSEIDTGRRPPVR